MRNTAGMTAGGVSGLSVGFEVVQTTKAGPCHVEALNPLPAKYPTLYAYAVAVTSVLAVVALRAALSPLVGATAPVILFLVPVAFSAWFGGLGPGLLATVLGGAAGIALFAVPGETTHSASYLWLAYGVPFLVVGAIISLLAGRAETARLSARTNERHARDSSAALRRTEDLQRRIFESASDFSIFTTDLDRVITSWSLGAENVFGYGAGDAIGMRADELFTPEDRAAEVPKRETGNALRDGRAADERWHLRKDGRRFFASGVVTPLRDETGTVIGFTKVARDATEQHTIRQALATSEAAFRQLADSMPQIVFSAGPDGHVDYFNRQWYAYTGTEVGQVGYENWRHVHEPERLPAINAVWQTALKNGTTYENEYQLRRHDGVFRWHLGRALPVRDEHGKIVRWYGTNTDIHDQKLLEADRQALLDSERAARTEAEQASRMKDEFLATISHELRTPLSAITGWAGLLQTVKGDTELLDEGLDVIARNAGAQARLIEDILDVSRITSGKVRLNVRQMDLRGPINAAIDTVATAANAKGVAIVRVQFDGPAEVAGDPERLQQIFWNLLANAIKFTDRGGTITVALRASASRLCVDVTDTGRGIEAEFLPFVFDRFRQADMSSTRRQGGLGLGLSIVRHLVELHGGTVSVDSRGTGHGCTFSVDLPYIAVQHEDGPAGPMSTARRVVQADCSPTLSGAKFLVIDDEPDARRMIQAMLGHCGTTVTAVGNVAEALAVLSADHEFDAIISDIGMPEADGYTLIRRLNELEARQAFRRVPIAALTAYTRDSDRTAVLAAGFDYFLTKPVEPSDLIETAARMAAGRPSSA